MDENRPRRDTILADAPGAGQKGVGRVRIRRRLILAGLLALVVIVVCVRAGFWQLDRLEQRRAYNAAVEAAIAAAPLPLASRSIAEITAAPDDFLYRRAIAEGVYLHDQVVVLRGRAHEGSPGVHLVTPLRLSPGGELVLVNRGWVPSADGATLDPREYEAHGPQVVEGSLEAVPDAGAQAGPLTLDADGYQVETFRRLDRATMSARLGEPVPPLYIQRLPGGPGEEVFPAAVPPPPLDEGPHLGYAIQWFSFATIALVGFGVLVHQSRASRGARR